MERLGLWTQDPDEVKKRGNEWEAADLSGCKRRRNFFDQQLDRRTCAFSNAMPGIPFHNTWLHRNDHKTLTPHLIESKRNTLTCMWTVSIGLAQFRSENTDCWT